MVQLMQFFTANIKKKHLYYVLNIKRKIKIMEPKLQIKIKIRKIDK